MSHKKSDRKQKGSSLANPVRGFGVSLFALGHYLAPPSPTPPPQMSLCQGVPSPPLQGPSRKCAKAKNNPLMEAKDR